jgi:hypothetical protein
MTNKDSAYTQCLEDVGDREKPGTERAAKLILVYYVPPPTLSSWHPTLGTEAEAIQSSPRFFPVSLY